jgi:hypothetical protein
MQLVEGIDLDRYVKARGPLSVQDALSVTAQVASATFTKTLASSTKHFPTTARLSASNPIWP